MTAALGADLRTDVLRRLLAAAGSPVPWDSLARETGAAGHEGPLGRPSLAGRDRVGVALAGLSAAGDRLQIDPARGVALLEAADRTDRPDLLAFFPEGSWVREVRAARTVSSTIDLAREGALAGAPAGTAWVAEEQRAGRGRRQRAFWSPPGMGIWATVLVRPAPAGRGSAGGGAWLPLLAGLAVVEVLTELGLPARSKWPNDVRVGGRKVCGAMAEAVHRGGAPVAASVSIGLNVHQGDGDFPAEAGVATSLAGAFARAGRPPPAGALHRPRLLARLLSAFGEGLARFDAEGPSFPRRLWERTSEELGQEVEHGTCEDRRRGRVVGLDDEARLLVEDPEGGRRTLAADLLERLGPVEGA